MKPRTISMICCVFLLSAFGVSGQKPSFEALFKKALECEKCPDSTRIALFTAALDRGMTDFLDFDNFYNALVNRGILYDDNGFYKEAIGDFKLALDIMPDGYNVLHKLGVAYLQNGQYTEAIAMFDRYLAGVLDFKVKSLAQFAADTLGGKNASTVEFNERMRGAAIAEYDRQLAMGYNNRGLAKAGLHNHAAACADFRKAYKAGMVGLKDFLQAQCP